MNANTASNFVTVNTFTTPNAIVMMSNLKINQKDFTFTVDLSLCHSDMCTVPQKITGKVTVEVMNWITLVQDEKIQVKADNPKGFEWIKTGKRITRFQQYLNKIGFTTLSDSHDTLSELVFECHNNSENYLENPFRLITRLDGTASINMVNIPSKRRVETINEETGEHTIRYSTKYGTMADGKVVKAFIHPTKYRRFIFQETVQREIYTPEVAE